MDKLSRSSRVNRNGNWDGTWQFPLVPLDRSRRPPADHGGQILNPLIAEVPTIFTARWRLAIGTHCADRLFGAAPRRRRSKPSVHPPASRRPKAQQCPEVPRSGLLFQHFFVFSPGQLSPNARCSRKGSRVCGGHGSDPSSIEMPSRRWTEKPQSSSFIVILSIVHSIRQERAPIAVPIRPLPQSPRSLRRGRRSLGSVFAKTATRCHSPFDNAPPPDVPKLVSWVRQSSRINKRCIRLARHRPRSQPSSSCSLRFQYPFMGTAANDASFRISLTTFLLPYGQATPPMCPYIFAPRASSSKAKETSTISPLAATQDGRSAHPPPTG